jgi:hypothetical protein
MVGKEESSRLNGLNSTRNASVLKIIPLRVW